MNIKIDEKAYNAVLKAGGVLVIKAVTTSCGWAGSVKNLWVEATRGVDNEKYYNLTKFKDIKIYVHQSVKVKDLIDITLKLRIPFIGSIFNVKGVSV